MHFGLHQVKMEANTCTCTYISGYTQWPFLFNVCLLTMTFFFLKRHIPNCSHWVQQDSPDLVNQYMREFLSKESWWTLKTCYFLSYGREHPFGFIILGLLHFLPTVLYSLVDILLVNEISFRILNFELSWSVVEMWHSCVNWPLSVTG